MKSNPKPPVALPGIALVLAAVACFATLDTATRWVSLTGAPALMTVWFRYLLQALLTGGWVLRHRRKQGLSGPLLRTKAPSLQLLRAALLLASSCLAFLSLAQMPVGEFTAVTMLTPLLVMVLASFLLGEFVPWTRWLCLAGGLAGALLVVAPGGAQVNRLLLLPLMVVFTNASYQLLTSRLARIDPPATTQLCTGLIGAGFATLLLPWHWASLSPGTWAVLLLMGLASTLGHLLLTIAYTRAPVTQLTPFLYAQIAFGALGGWWVFGHVPSPTARLGIALIAGFGVAAIWGRSRRAVKA